MNIILKIVNKCGICGGKCRKLTKWKTIGLTVLENEIIEDQNYVVGYLTNERVISFPSERMTAGIRFDLTAYCCSMNNPWITGYWDTFAVFVQ